jgi:hypothetical protein
MTPKEKARELVDKFSDLEDGEMYIGKAKLCALIAVDEILKTDPMIIWGESDTGIDYKSNDEYWNEVKQEINKL